ncbi:MAG: ATP-binding protein [Gammaproteobacteria bacterium]|nr:ATP-binding protein [Gammaproteobacteria bacterium]
MLHRYNFSNFFSFEQETEISFLLNDKAPQDSLAVTCDTGERLSKVLAVIGANGSGKTNVIKPLAFLDWFVGDSFHAKPDAKIPIEPHFFCDKGESTFEVEFDWDKSLWRYTATVTPDRVLAEALYRKTSRAFSYVFMRKWMDESKSYEVKQQGFGFSPREAEKVRENASLISTAAQYDVPLAHDMIAAQRIYTNVNYSGRSHLNVDQLLTASNFFVDPDHADMRIRMVDLLKSWDLGLSGVAIRKIPVTEASGTQKEVFVPFGLHDCDSKQAELALFQESSGTQGAFVLLAKLLPALASGGIAVIDEMEVDLHPHMLTPIMDLFLDKESNPLNAQVIFTCHSMEIFNLLHKWQVVLVQKGNDCRSEAWRLDSMQGVRSDDNLYAKYMSGTYGAVPGV